MTTRIPAPFPPLAKYRTSFPPKTLAALRELEPDAIPWANLETLMLPLMVMVSDRKRMDAGAKGLILEAARRFLRLGMAEVAKARFAKGDLLLWDGGLIEPLARELELEMVNNPNLQRETVEGLTMLRDRMWSDDSLTNGDPKLVTNYKGKDALVTFVEALDYIQHLALLRRGGKFVTLKRQCLSCIRVINAVFATDY